MAVAPALLAASTFGTSDFAAGLASRRFPSGSVTGVARAAGPVVAALAVLVAPGSGPSVVRPSRCWSA